LKKEIKIEEFSYELPEERIARFPLPDRTASKLLVYKNGNISHAHFRELLNFLPGNSQLFLNETRVIPARIQIFKPTGAAIEIFLLEPVEPSTSEQIMLTTSGCVWQCLIGNKKKWNADLVLSVEVPVRDQQVTLTISWVDRDQDHISFQWDYSNHTFSTILESIGKMPIPPYLKRAAAQSDQTDYQTVFARREGAVAAPTASLHLDESMWNMLQERYDLGYVTLHVGAGTFQPVKATYLKDHNMHFEQVQIPLKTIKLLASTSTSFRVAVGTTSLRTLESLYWHGLQCMKSGLVPIDVTALQPYQQASEPNVPVREVMTHLANSMEAEGWEEIGGKTQLFIMPGYRFSVCDGLITNFHQPASTLLALVAAFVGPDWKKIYASAMEKNYRFLSYGDSSLLFRSGFEHIANEYSETQTN